MKLYLAQKNENKNILKSIGMKKLRLVNFLVNVLQYGRRVFWRKKYTKELFDVWIVHTRIEDKLWRYGYLTAKKIAKGKSIAREASATAAVVQVSLAEASPMMHFSGHFFSEIIWLVPVLAQYVLFDLVFCYA